MELRAYQEGRAKKLAGYAATYNRRSKNLFSRVFGWFQEVLMPGAFDGVVSDKKCPAGCECKFCSVVATINHNMDQIIGRVGSGTLKLDPDKKGLRFEVTLPDTTYANDLYENVRAGNMTGCSFAFRGDDVEDDWDDRPLGAANEEEGRGIVDKAKDAVKKFITRRIKKFRALIDVSVVSDPAYTGTSVNARSLAAATELRSRLDIAHGTELGFKRNPGLAEDAGRRARALEATIDLPATWPISNDRGAELVDVILEGRKLAAKKELNTLEHRRFWFCVSAVTAIKCGAMLNNLEIDYRNKLLAEIS